MPSAQEPPLWTLRTVTVMMPRSPPVLRLLWWVGREKRVEGLLRNSELLRTQEALVGRGLHVAMTVVCDSAPLVLRLLW